MTENIHLHDAEGNHAGDICVPGEAEYRTFVHYRNERKLTFSGGPFDSISEAFTSLGRVLQENRRKHRHINRAVITWREKGISYYEAEWAYEVVVR